MSTLLEFGLKSKVALVAGAGQGMGEASVRGLAEAGAKIVCLDIDRERAEACAERVQQQGNDALAVCGDARNRADVDAAVSAAVQRFGALHVVIDIVGQKLGKDILDSSDEDYEAVFSVVLKPLYLLAQSAGRQMIAQRSGGAIISINSLSGFFSAEHHGLYGAAKAAMASLTRTCAVEFAPHGVRVNAVAPGLTLTPRLARRMADNPDWLASILPSIPLGRLGALDDMARAAIFLASEMASYITGQVLFVDGGTGIKSPFPPVRI